MLKRRKPNLYQIWPDTRKRKRPLKSTRLPWSLAVLVFLAVFGGGMAATAWTEDKGELFRNAPLAALNQMRDTVAHYDESGEPAARSFSFCHVRGGRNCVVDGDTFWMDGIKIRIADIDTPETHPPRCAAEAELGDRATVRLHELLNAGPFEVQPLPGRDSDRYGRALRIVTRNGRSLGDQLVNEGLARTWTGRREPWC